ncbi:hypothetical protein EM20IM_09345 [Candidatus Methylacidiphilum infernorum]|uniref:Periplasmic protein TonB n=1 Tax=Candidatus Methylacidiphilum infernorum TaxID=511746 RepID=A0ABX7PVB3_9BACT|nr:hypothetical protein EM20IM_09345 [Candidatus Methylacidiphilum infernorum]
MPFLFGCAKYFLCFKKNLFIVTKQKSNLRGFLFISFVIHLAFTLFLGSGVLHRFFPEATPHDPPPPTLTMLEMVQPESFIPTEEWQKTDHPDPNALLQSDRSTSLRSQETPQKENSPLPQLSGDPRSSMSYIDVPSSRPSPPRPSGKSTPAQRQPALRKMENENQKPPTPTLTPKTAVQKQSKTEETKEDSQPKETIKEPSKTIRDENSKEENPAKALEKLLKEINNPTEEYLKKEDPNGDPLMPFQNKSPKAPAQKEGKEATNNSSSQSPTQNNAATASDRLEPVSQPSPPPAPPPSPESFERHRMQIAGGRTAELGPVSPSARETELGRYKARLYRAIGSRWYLEVEQSMGLLAIGSVRIRFYVQSDGTVSSIQVINEEGITEVLRSISLDSIRLSAPFGPFSEAMKGQIGNGFWEEITFTIY